MFNGSFIVGIDALLRVIHENVQLSTCKLLYKECEAFNIRLVRDIKIENMDLRVFEMIPRLVR